MRPRLLIYLTLGFPDNKFLEEFVLSIPEGTVDGLELGLPSSDPRYDGPKIRSTHGEKSSFDIDQIGGIMQICRDQEIRVNILSYYSDIEKAGERFLQGLSRHTVHEMIVPDLLIDYTEEADTFINRMREAGISYIPFFNAATPDRVIEKYLEMTDSWIYYGLQPSTGINVPVNISEVVERALSLINQRDIIFGFGIRNGSDAAEIIRAGGHGIAIGSAIVDDIRRRDRDAAVYKIREYREALDSAV
ncbi:MAG: tryptophan synthase subunit alpha [Candidatus Thermoplasmatota archaeon]|nr:tryptophan synthase subunit alpha [Candidatus Thermoplasmatota archaeon]